MLGQRYFRWKIEDKDYNNRILIQGIGVRNIGIPLKGISVTHINVESRYYIRGVLLRT